MDATQASAAAKREHDKKERTQKLTALHTERQQQHEQHLAKQRDLQEQQRQTTLEGLKRYETTGQVREAIVSKSVEKLHAKKHLSDEKHAGVKSFHHEQRLQRLERQGALEGKYATDNARVSATKSGVAKLGEQHRQRELSQSMRISAHHERLSAERRQQQDEHDLLARSVGSTRSSTGSMKQLHTI
eukprot:TRINITY_DN2416_c0_g1_i2.p1 TRINITY_DN2416_c0_g1~~TRINITY_DN2416_c0_g1_i2.p1  ORF type:complete len:187 (+),score=69.11 TRINITY_DN2416_c0_g1_i2:372-932(+)